MLYFSLVSVGVQKVGPCTHLHTHSTKTEDMLSAENLLAVQRSVFTGELSLESTQYVNEFENIN